MSEAVNVKAARLGWRCMRAWAVLMPTTFLRRAAPNASPPSIITTTITATATHHHHHHNPHRHSQRQCATSMTTFSLITPSTTTTATTTTTAHNQCQSATGATNRLSSAPSSNHPILAENYEFFICSLFVDGEKERKLARRENYFKE